MERPTPKRARRTRRPRSVGVAVLVVVTLIAAACTGSDDSSDSAPPDAPDGTAADQPGSGWRLSTYAEVDGEQTLVAVGEARLDDDGEVTALRTDFSDGSVSGVVSINEYGAFLGFPKPGRSASADGHQWVHLAPAGVEGSAPDPVPLEVDVDGPLREVDTSEFGRLRVLSKPGQLVPTADGSVVLQLAEEWVDDDDVVRRRLTWTAVVDAEGEIEWSVSVADRDDAVDPSPLGTTPSVAMPLAALVRAAGATPTGPSDGEPAAPPPSTTRPPGVGEPGRFEPAGGGPGAHLAGGNQSCIIDNYYEGDIVLRVYINCPPERVDADFPPPRALEPPSLDEDRTQQLPPSPASNEQRDDRVEDSLKCLGGLFGSGFSIYGLVKAVSAAAAFHPVAGVVVLAAAIGSALVAGAVVGWYCDKAWGDPHIETLDGTQYDFQAAGEFVTVKSPVFEVQQRYHGVGSLFSILAAVAVRVGEHVVEVIVPSDDSEASEAEVRIDGEVTELDHDGMVLGNGTYVALTPGTTHDVVVIAPDGSWVSVVDNSPSNLDASTSVSEATANQVSGGISGTPDGDGANDFTLRDGTVVPRTEIRTVEGLYGRFGSDWRVRPEERLFTDTPAEQWLTEEIVSFPTSTSSLADFTPEQIAEARAQCEAAGVTDPATLDDCAYDVLVSGDPAWAERAAEGVNGQPNPGRDDDPRSDGDAPLLIAADNCDIERLEAELGAGESPNLRRGDDGWTPLHFAAQAGCTEGVRVLAEWGARLDPRTDDTGELPLRLAAQNGYEETVAELVDVGAPPDLTRSDDGSTPMLAAAFRGHTAVVATLLESGATVDVANDEGFTPLQAAVQEGYPEVALILLDAGADPDRPDDQGRTALIAAAVNGDGGAVAMLLDAGADPNRGRASDGVTALHFGAQDGYTEVVALLLDAGVDPNIADDGGTTPLHLAASNDQVEVVTLLLAAGADPATADDQGRTPRDVAGEAAAELL